MREVTEYDQRLSALMHGAEVAFGNLETPLTARGVRAEKAATHRAHPDRIAEVKRFGFDVVTLANNHMLDYGQEGLADTLDALKNASVAAVGAGATRAAAFRPFVQSTGGGGIAFIGVCAALPPGYAATADRPGVAPLRVLQSVAIDPALQAEQPGGAPFMHTHAVDEDLTEACDAIRSVREEARMIVVALHWGIPHGFAARSYGVLAEYQRPVAHALVDAGADLIVGHHPHVVHPVERYGNGFIAYSLGNYVFHSWGHFARASGDAIPADATTDPAEQTLVLDMPLAPFRNPFGAEEMLESIVLTVDRPADANGAFRLRFIPTVMRSGDPWIPDATRCEDVLHRLTRPALPLWQGGYTPHLAIVRDQKLGATVGELVLDRR